MRITRIKAVPISFRVPEGQNVRLGIGRAVKRDSVLVTVTDRRGLSSARARRITPRPATSPS